MAKHRVGDRRIITVSIPEDLARRLDARVGQGREKVKSELDLNEKLMKNVLSDVKDYLELS